MTEQPKLASSVPLAVALQRLRESMAADVRADICHWCERACGGTCLGVNNAAGPVQMRPDDPAYWMLKDGTTSTPVVFREDCSICRDPEFAQMGLPLCQLCEACGTGHVAADDEVCDDCGANAREIWEAQQQGESPE